MVGIFLYGGCVTRDTFEYLKVDHTLTGYVARQSLISAASEPTTLATPTVGNNFEQRAVQGDLGSTLHPALAAAEKATDAFVMDLLVERFGVLELPNGSYVTRTPNMRESGAIDSLWSTLEHVEMGSEKHFRLWSLAAQQLVDALRQIGMLERTLLIETPWADVSECGKPVKRYAGWSPEHAASLYEPYYSVIRDLGIRTVRLPLELAVSTQEHRWGPSPYHYVPAAYEWMRDQILDAIPEHIA